jgi:hypothetical protein
MAKLIHVEKVETWMGTTYRFYVRGVYFGVAATRAKLLEAAKEALESWDFKTMKRKRPPK